jgi:hypothetical protein
MKSFILLLLTFSSIWIRAQADLGTSPLMRIEIPVQSDQETFRVIPCSQRGFLLFYKSVEMVDETRIKWIFVFYTPDFKQSWIKSVPIDGDHDLIVTSWQGSDTLSFLFSYTGKSKEEAGDMNIIRLIFPSATFIVNSFHIPGAVQPCAMYTRNSYGVIGLNVKDNVAQLAWIDLASGKTRIFPSGPGNMTRIVELKAHITDPGIITILSKQVNRKVEEFYLVVFDTSGHTVIDTRISSIDPQRILSSVKCVQSNKDSIAILGTYRIDGTGSKSHSDDTGEIAGLYYTLFAKANQVDFSFIPLMDLKNIGLLMSEKDILNIKKKALKKSEGQSELTLGFYFLLHDIISSHDGYLFLADIYFPQYHTEYFTDFDYYGRPYSNTYSVFDGYRFTNALAVALNNQGRMQWDQVMEIRNLLSFELKPKMNILLKHDTLLMCYLGDGKIGSKLFLRDKLLGKLEYDPVELSHPEDKLISESRSYMAYWYNDYFLCFGYQEIKNIALGQNNKRKVFFINKMEFWH